VRRPAGAVPIAVASGLLSVLLAVAVNVATGGRLPGWLMPYAWLAWPAVGLLTVVVVGLAVLSVGRPAPPPAPVAVERMDGRSAAQPETVPVTLPGDPRVVGRDREVAGIERAVAAGFGVVVLAAAPGSGKTTLALHYAHLVAADFPDGRLFAALGGSSAAPVPPAEILTRFLADFGVPPDERRRSVADLAARLRTVVADRRVLLVLDDARDAAQVAPLLPGGRGCRVIVTSRRALSDVPGAAVVAIGALAERDAVRLLAATVGDDRVAADPAGAARVVEACGRLPLAVLIAGNRLRVRPGWTIGAFAEALHDERGRLDALSHSDAAVRATFRGAYDALPDGDRLVFRRACSHPGRQFTTAAAAARCDLGEAGTGAALDRLTDLFLVESPEPGRFRSHDLLRLFARDLLDEQERIGCTARLLDWQTRTAAAGQWLSHERESVLLLLAEATDAGLDEPAWRLVEVVHRLLTAADEHVYRMRLWQLGEQIAVRLGDDIRQARAVRWVAHSYAARGEATLALRLSHRALALVEGSGDRWEIAQSARRVGESLRQLNRFDEAETALLRALSLFVAAGDTGEEVEVRVALGTLYNTFGHPERSLPMLERAVRLLPDREQPIHGWVLLNLGLAAKLAGRRDVAAGHIGAASAVANRLGDDYLRGYCHLERAWLAGDTGDTGTAAAGFTEARDLFQRIQDGAGLGVAYEGLGMTAAWRGDHAEAAALLAVAVDQYVRLGNPAREGECRLQRAAQLVALGDTAAASTERRRADALLGDTPIRLGPQIAALLPRLDERP
jgi:tetratricopeptide (TPR) repeat protein